MRTRLWIGAAALALGAGGVYLMPRPAAPEPAAVPVAVAAPDCCPTAPATPSSSEECDAVPDCPAPREVVESIVVERPAPAEPTGQDALPELVLPIPATAEAPQPPRPDAVTLTLRMPYADETAVDRPALLTVEEAAALRSGLGTPEPAGDAEEAEAPPEMPETPEPPTSSVDYHRLYPHCPYTGRCLSPDHAMPRR